jgi:hypothetical protein
MHSAEPQKYGVTEEHHWEDVIEGGTNHVPTLRYLCEGTEFDIRPSPVVPYCNENSNSKSI